MNDKRNTGIKWMMLITIFGIWMMMMTLFCSWNLIDDERPFCKALIEPDKKPRDFYGRPIGNKK